MPTGPLEWAVHPAQWLGSIPNRLTNFLNTTNNPIDRKVRTMIRSFACDYETLKRLAEIEESVILDDFCPADFTVADARDYAVSSELKRISERKETRESLYGALFKAAMKISAATVVTRAELTYAQKNEAYRLIDALNMFAKTL